jgi:ribosome biogenesis GTPase A
MNNPKQVQVEELANTLDDIATLIGSFQSDQVTLYNQTKIVAGLGQLTDAIALRRRVQDIRQGVFTLLVVGKFKHGKSTLINAIMGREMVRARAIPTTAIITVLVNGMRTDVAIYKRDSSEPRYISWNSFMDEYSLKLDDQDTDKGDRFTNINYAQLETAHPFIAQGVKLVDSPGLGEEDTRTETTLRFLKEAQAVILVLDANKLLGDDERKFIREHLGTGRLEHVFFVVNRIDQVEGGELTNVQDRLKTALKRHFVDQKGKFDEDFFNRRIFFINAKSALDERRKEILNEKVIERSGVPRLEGEITHVLTSEERLRAVTASSVQSLLGIIIDAHHQIIRQKVAVTQSVADLVKRRDRVRQNVKNLEQRQKNIQKQVNNSGETIYLKAKLNLDTYIENLEEHWDKKSSEILPLTNINLGDLVQCSYDEAAKLRIVNVVQAEVTAYIQKELAEWSKKLRPTLQADMKSIEKMVHSEVESFQRELSQVQDEFAAGKTIIKIDAKGLKLEFGSISSSPMSGDTGEWNEIIQGAINRLYVVLAVWILGFFNPLVLAAAVVGAFMGMGFSNPFRVMDGFRVRLREKVGGDIHTRLKSDPQLQKVLRDSLTQHFAEMGDIISSELGGRIDDVSRQMQHVIETLQNQNFSVIRETKRLEQIEHELEQLFNGISMSIYNRTYRLDELPELIE